MMNGVDGLEPASGGHIVAHFRRFDFGAAWVQNWDQGPTETEWQVKGTTSTIQGIMSCIHLDHTLNWLLMISDANGAVSYLATSFHQQRWPWSWIHAESNHHALALFADWVTLGADFEAVSVPRETSG